MLGDRRQLVDLLTGQLRPALHDLLPAKTATSTAYPNHDGVVLAAGEGVLTFAGLQRLTPELDADQLREQLDLVLRAGVLRRGLILRCQTCEEVQFTPIDKVSQTWTCIRCDAPNDLNQPSWKKPIDEPGWYYDLHPVCPHLLRDHGDVPALLSAHLAAQPPARTAAFHEISELEFVVDNSPQVEIDLIAYTNDTLTIAECKSNNHLATDKAGARAEVQKKCQAAAWLQADQLLFATTAPTWAKNTTGIIHTAVTTFTWGPLGPPSVNLLTGLGTSTPDTTPVVPSAGQQVLHQADS
jgi:hypothetical protein